MGRCGESLKIQYLNCIREARVSHESEWPCLFLFLYFCIYCNIYSFPFLPGGYVQDHLAQHRLEGGLEACIEGLSPLCRKGRQFGSWQFVKDRQFGSWLVMNKDIFPRIPQL